GGGKTLAIVAVVLVLVVGIPAALVWWGFRWVSNKGEELIGAGDCSLVKNEVVRDALGEPIELLQGSGLGGLVSGIIDSRVLPDAPSCWGTSEVDGPKNGTIVRVAVQQGNAKAGFQNEVKKSKGGVVAESTSDDGGVTVTTEA